MSRGELKKLSSLFDKYKERLIAPESTIVDAFIDVAADLGLKLGKENVRYQPMTRTLSISSAGMLRSEIKLREQELLLHLTGRLGQRNAPKKII